MPKLLIVDDEPVICQSFAWVFANRGVEVVAAESVAEGWRRFVADRPDVIVLDYQLGDGTGMELFDRIRAADATRPVIFLTAQGTTDTAIEAMKRGAFDYLGKPLELEAISRLLDRAFEAAQQTAKSTIAQEAFSNNRIVGHSATMREISKQIGRVAPLEVVVLILGESGTGKELVARAIHRHSPRAAHPFVAINCAAIPEGLVESELFGHEAGAFTGAAKQRIGRFEQANGGTIFLDEIGDMPAAVQAKVLRFLQDQTFERIGGREPVKTHVRILAATNHDLERLIAEGRFRRDLYYRLKEVTIALPPLRDRAEDIPELARHFLARFSHETGRTVTDFAPGVLELFQKHSWPGNVRELRGTVREATLRTTGRMILPEFLPPGLTPATETKSRDAAHDPERFDLAGRIEAMLDAGEGEIYDRIVGAVERQLIARVLRYTQGHQGRACELLGIDRKTLRNKLRELDITVDKTVTDASEHPEG